MEGFTREELLAEAKRRGLAREPAAAHLARPSREPGSVDYTVEDRAGASIPFVTKNRVTNQEPVTLAETPDMSFGGRMKRGAGVIKGAAEAAAPKVGPAVADAVDSVSFGTFRPVQQGWEKLTGTEGPNSLTAGMDRFREENPIASGIVEGVASLPKRTPLGMVGTAFDELVSTIGRRLVKQTLTTAAGKLAATGVRGAATGALTAGADMAIRKAGGQDVGNVGDNLGTSGLVGAGFNMVAHGAQAGEAAMRKHNPELQILADSGLEPRLPLPGPAVKASAGVPPELKPIVERAIPKGKVTPGTRSASGRQAFDKVQAGYEAQDRANNETFGRREADLNASEGHNIADMSVAEAAIRSLNTGKQTEATHRELERIITNLEASGGRDEHGNLLATAKGINEERARIGRATGADEFQKAGGDQVALMKAQEILRNVLAVPEAPEQAGPPAVKGPGLPEPRGHAPTDDPYDFNIGDVDLGKRTGTATPATREAEHNARLPESVQEWNRKFPEYPRGGPGLVNNRFANIPNLFDHVPELDAGFQPTGIESNTVPGEYREPFDRQKAHDKAVARAEARKAEAEANSISVEPPRYPRSGIAPGIAKLNAEHAAIAESMAKRYDLLRGDADNMSRNPDEKMRRSGARAISERGENSVPSGAGTAEGGHAIDRLKAMGAEHPVLSAHEGASQSEDPLIRGAGAVPQDDLHAYLDAPRLQLAIERQQMSPAQMWSTAKVSGGMLHHGAEVAADRLLYPALKAGSRMRAGGNVVGADELTRALSKRKKKKEQD